MKVVQISDTHGLYRRLGPLPEGDVVVHCGDVSHEGTEEEVLDFLNWFIDLPYPHKIFVTGNHDLCLWDAESIEDLPDNLLFLQDEIVTIDSVKFFGLGYNHPEALIPEGMDVVVTHEPPLHILDRSNGVNWGNLAIEERIREVAPRYHLFGHSHEAHGVKKSGGTVYSNGSLLDDKGEIAYKPIIFEI